MPIKQGTRVLITAAASGIGRITAELFHHHGATVHVCDISEEKIASLGQAAPEISASLVDVSQPDQVDRLFEDVNQRLGGLDVLINNAGVAGPTGPIEKLSVEGWEQTLAVNISGQFYCTRLAVPMIKAAGGGSIINLSSVAGRLGYPLRTPYAASKWAVIGFTKSLAGELGPDQIRVNALLPGLASGERAEGVISARAREKNVPHEEMRQEYLEAISLKKLTDPGDVAQMALFLCSDEGKGISGQALSVCGNTEFLK